MTGRLEAGGNTLFVAALALSAAAHLLAILLLPGLAPMTPRPEKRYFSVTLVQPQPALPAQATPTLAPAAPAPAAPRAEPAPVLEEPLEAAPQAEEPGEPAAPPEAAVASAVSAPTAAAAQSADSAARDEAGAIARILSDLRAAISAELRYPALARSRGWQGTAVVLARLDGTGNLLEAAVRRSSNYEVLDRAALALIRKVLPVPNPLGRPLSIEIPIAYELR